MLDFDKMIKEMVNYAEAGDPMKDVLERYGKSESEVLLTLARAYLAQLADARGGGRVRVRV